MSRVVLSPPATGVRADGMLPGGWWHDDPATGRMVCDLCPRACHLKPGDRGFCFVRQNLDGAMVLTTYGKSTGFCIDPIEKKPLNHFYPGTSVLSFGTAGCNLGCKFCQNWDISKSRAVERLSEIATPDAIAEAARAHGCRSVAFTYNDPVIWAEYAIDTARACRAVGVKTVAVTAGYITPAARGAFYEFIDAANVDLKGFTEEFYEKITYSHLQPVLETLEWLKRETAVWFEITNLVIPRANDSPDDLRRMSRWILDHCGDEVPVHFTAFHPDFRMLDRPPTPHETLLAAHEIARREGLKYVYVGNVNDVAHQSTYCPHCGALAVERDWYALGAYQLRGNRCARCDGTVAGHFDERPGDWGRRRLPVEIARFARVPDLTSLIEPGALMQPTPGQPAREAPPSPRLTGQQEGTILSAAAAVVLASLLGRPARLDDPTLAGASELPVIGAYVTLKRRGQLRACCGFLGEPRRLAEALAHAARITATEDYRLPPISTTELPFLDLSVNLLHDDRPLTARGRDRIAAVEVGRHGLRIRRGTESGLLLPAVPVENGWDSETYLRQICRKAGLPTTAWEADDVTLDTFESVEFGAPFDVGVLGREDLDGSSGVSPQDLQTLARHAATNCRALARGLAPNYYTYGIADGNVTGVALSLEPPGGVEPVHFARLSLRPGLPLQATLFQLCEHAAGFLRQASLAPESVRVGLTLLFDPAMHGTASQPDPRGLDPARRALLLIEQDKSAWIYRPSATPEALVESVREGFPLMNHDGAHLYSLAVESTEPEVVFRSFPRPVADARPRPPGVAGTFYPAEPAALSALVDGLLGATERRPETWAAAMVPHAGLRYSGAVAASVFNRLEIPGRVLIIGPKHTRLGVDWAVSPHDSWALPGATVPADPEFARLLADGINGLELDATAHQQEHAIEVELPFLARLAPDSKVVGIALSGGDWESCRRFAHELAAVIRRLPTPPLLLISSDMNHFATDRENRRLDAIALEAMERLDPAHLLATVLAHNISMCGVVPAVIVMETLRTLGGLSTCTRAGYGTSAEVSGDASRVVGYAGALLN